MENPNNSDTVLILFLRNLADSVERQQLLPIQLKSIGEFFMSYQFQEQAIRDNDTTSNQPTHQFSHKEMLKFITLGWFCYCVMLRNESIPCISNDDLE